MKIFKGYIKLWKKWTPGVDTAVAGYPANLGFCIRGYKVNEIDDAAKLSNSIRTSLVVKLTAKDDGNIECETLNSIYILVYEDKSAR